jgi:exopolyphosphatase / guanosine-5'-triphosphate,3'-diphosphate pyrophosphatase
VSNQAYNVIAAVDLGSNSFHMLVCSYHNGGLQIIDRLKEMVRLASGLDKRDMLDEKAQARALACLERFSQRIRNFPAANVRVVGTNTLRTAKNAREFLIKAEQALGHNIHIISGIEEARLIYMGVAYSIGSNGQQRRLVMDIGGGSTEYIIGTGHTPLLKESLNMGCVVVSDQFFKEGRLSKTSLEQAILSAEQRLEPFQKQFNRRHWQEAIGASGSLRAIAKVLASKGWCQHGINRVGLEQLLNHMQQYQHVQQLGLDLDAERLPVFAGGVAITYATFKSLQIEQMTISDGALREGLALDLLGRLSDDDIRSSTVVALAKRYHTDQEHTDRIQQTLATMIAQLAHDNPLFKDTNAVQFLQWAARLHEIGMDIAHSQYHKHSAYVIENGDLAGFSSQDQKVLAAIVKAHRRKFTKTDFNHLPAPWQQEAIYLSTILRLAVVLHRNRSPQALPDFKIALIKNKIQLNFPKDTLAQLPLTHADLVQEAGYFKSAGFKLEFS